MTNQQDSDNEKTVFSVTVGDIQQESMRLIGRELTGEELDTASDEVDWGSVNRHIHCFQGCY